MSTRAQITETRRSSTPRLWLSAGAIVLTLALSLVLAPIADATTGGSQRRFTRPVIARSNGRIALVLTLTVSPAQSSATSLDRAQALAATR